MLTAGCARGSNVGLEQSLAEKQAKIESVQNECKRIRRQVCRAARSQACRCEACTLIPTLALAQVFEKDRLISLFGRDLHKLVTNTEPHLWRESVKALYRTYAKKGAAEMTDGGDEEQVEQEFMLQRQYMERALGALKTRVGRTEEKTQQDFQKKVSENTMLIKECNALRTDNKDLRYQNAQLHMELQQQARSAKAPLRRQPSAGAMRPSTAGRLASESLPSMRAESGGARGQLLKGSASVSGRERAKMAEMLVAQVCSAALVTTWAPHASWAPPLSPGKCDSLHSGRINREPKSKCSAAKSNDCASRRAN